MRATDRSRRSALGPRARTATGRQPAVGIVPLLLLLCATLPACGRPSGGSAAARDSTLVVLAPHADEWLFGPAQADEAMHLMYLPLAREGPDGEVEGVLIRDWEHTDDFRHWTIHLRTDVRWHDGVPVTAHDVAFTIDLLTHPDVALIPADAFSIDVVDDSTYTVDIVTNDYRTVTPLDRTRRGIPLPRHLLSDLDPADFGEWEYWLRPVGNGPYRYLRHTPQTMVELEANPDFYLGPPPVARVVVKFGGLHLTELLSESVDFALYVEWSDLQKLAGDPRFRSYWTKDTWVYMGLLWNVRSGPLADPIVRRAVTMALDRASLRRTLDMPPESRPIEAVFTERQYWNGSAPDPIPYDPEAARRLLEGAGWSPGPDGVWARGGESLSFEALVLLEDAIIETAAVQVQDQLRDFGVRMELVPLEAGVWIDRVRAGDFEATLGEVGTSPRSLASQFGPDGWTGYGDAHAWALIEEAGATIDPARTDSVYGELASILIRDLPATALFPDLEMHVAHRRLLGLSSPWRAVPLRTMEGVRLAPAGGP